MNIIMLVLALAFAQKYPGTAANYAEIAQEAAASVTPSDSDDLAYILG